MAEKKPFALRLDANLYAAIARLAAGDLRSVNGQIEYLLREALRTRGIRLGEEISAENQQDGETK